MEKSLKQLAHELGCSERTLRRYKKKGYDPRQKIEERRVNPRRGRGRPLGAKNGNETPRDPEALQILSLPYDFGLLGKLTANTSRIEWRRIGFNIRTHGEKIAWVARWRKFGNPRFGPKIVAQEIKRIGFSRKAVHESYYLSQLPESIVDTNISPRHSKVLVEELGENPIMMESWARKAIEENLTAGELRESIKSGKVIRNSQESPVTMKAISSPYVVRSYFDKWADATLKERPLEEWSVEDLKVLLDEFRPIWICTEKAAALWKMKRGAAPADGPEIGHRDRDKNTARQPDKPRKPF